MNTRRWYDNYWIGAAVTWVIIDLLQALHITGPTRVSTPLFAFDAAVLALAVNISYRNRSRSRSGGSEGR